MVKRLAGMPRPTQLPPNPKPNRVNPQAQRVEELVTVARTHAKYEEKLNSFTAILLAVVSMRNDPSGILDYLKTPMKYGDLHFEDKAANLEYLYEAYKVLSGDFLRVSGLQNNPAIVQEWIALLEKTGKQCEGIAAEIRGILEIDKSGKKPDFKPLRELLASYAPYNMKSWVDGQNAKKGQGRPSRPDPQTDYVCTLIQSIREETPGTTWAATTEQLIDRLKVRQKADPLAASAYKDLTAVDRGDPVDRIKQAFRRWQMDRDV